jgi:hypothetical protein
MNGPQIFADNTDQKSNKSVEETPLRSYLFF